MNRPVNQKQFDSYKLFTSDKLLRVSKGNVKSYTGGLYKVFDKLSYRQWVFHQPRGGDVTQSSKANLKDTGADFERTG